MGQPILLTTSIYATTNAERQAAIATAATVLQRRAAEYPGLTLASYNYATEQVPDDTQGIPVRRVLDRDPVTLFGVERRTPILRDVLDVACRESTALFGYINADIIVPRKTIELLAESQAPAVILARTDIAPCTVEQFEAGEISVVDDNHPGFDGVFFSKPWWQRARANFPADLVIGECAWDDTYNWLLYRLAPTHLRHRGLYHVKHGQAWTQGSKGGQHNLAIFNDVQHRCNAGAISVVN